MTNAHALKSAHELAQHGRRFPNDSDEMGLETADPAQDPRGAPDAMPR